MHTRWQGLKASLLLCAALAFVFLLLLADELLRLTKRDDVKVRLGLSPSQAGAFVVPVPRGLLGPQGSLAFRMQQ